MTGKWVVGWMAVTVVVAGVSVGAVAIAVDENGAGEASAPTSEPPAYRASIRKAPAEPGEAGGSVDTDEQQSPQSDSPKVKQDSGRAETQWVTDLDGPASSRPPDQPNRDDTAAPREKSAEDTTLDPSLAEILRIRRELGTNPYRGTIFEQVDSNPGAADGEASPSGDSARRESENEFADALRATVATAEAQPRFADPTPAAQYSRWRGDSAGDSHLAGDLRQAARGLDVKAADFEDVELYVEADQLRQLAGRLRATARRLRQGVAAANSR